MSGTTTTTPTFHVVIVDHSPNHPTWVESEFPQVLWNEYNKSSSSKDDDDTISDPSIACLEQLVLCHNNNNNNSQSCHHSFRLQVHLVNQNEEEDIPSFGTEDDSNISSRVVLVYFVYHPTFMDNPGWRNVTTTGTTTWTAVLVVRVWAFPAPHHDSSGSSYTRILPEDAAMRTTTTRIGHHHKTKIVVQNLIITAEERSTTASLRRLAQTTLRQFI